MHSPEQVARLPWGWIEQRRSSGGSIRSEDEVERTLFLVPVDALSPTQTVNGESSAHNEYTCGIETGMKIENISPLGDSEDDDGLLDKYPVAAEAKPIEVELRPGDVLYLPALWWYERITVAMADSKEAHGGGDNDGLSGVAVTLEFRYSAHSQALLHVAAALRDQMSFD